MDIRQYITNAVSYWERKRLIYNAVLAILTLICWGPELLFEGPRGWFGGGLVVLFFAVVANALYCLAYPVDLVLQVSPLNAFWGRTRWVLFASGTLIASWLALWIMLGQGMA